MTLPSSGQQISLGQINTEFGIGNNLGAYRGTRHFIDAGNTGLFPASPNSIDFDVFHSKRKDSPFSVSYQSSSVNGTPFSWSIANGVPGDSVVLTATGGTISGTKNYGTITLDSGGAYSRNDGDFTPDYGTITVTFTSTYKTVTKTIVVDSGIFSFSKIISSDTTDYNLRSDMITNGWDGSKKVNATVTINSGIYVKASTTGTYAFIIPSNITSGSTITLNNYGTILGKGGTGGTGGVPTVIGSSGYYGDGFTGGSAGPALFVSFATTINNYGVIAGGGGGGGGGSYITANKGAPNGHGGGGGGGGVGWGVGGAGGFGSTTYPGYDGGSADGWTVGAGGYDGWYRRYGVNNGWGVGGAGGGYGSSGAAGATFNANGGPGGSAGAAVVGTSYINGGGGAGGTVNGNVS